MSERPLVSVVIPTYNCAGYISEAICSVLVQTIGRDSVEILVLDDGSTDSTEQVVGRLDGAVRYVQLQHGGVSRARNAGIAMAAGEFIAFLDADDYWLPRRLELAVPLLQTTERIFVNTDYYMDTNGQLADQPFFKSRSFECLFTLDAQIQFDLAIETNFIHCMTIVPKRALEDVGGFNPRLNYGEDWDCWLRLLRLGYAARLVREPCAVYRYKRPGATTARFTHSQALDRLFVLSQYRDDVSPYRWRHASLWARWLSAKEALGRFMPALAR